MKRIIRLTENDLTNLVKRVINEQQILNEQLLLLAQPQNTISFGPGDNTKQITLKGVDPNTKRTLFLKYNISGSYGIFGFDVELRNIRRQPNGDLRAEAKPSNKTVHGILKGLVSKNNLTSDGWLYVKVPSVKISEAIDKLRKNKGQSAKLDAGFGVTINLQQV
jgi:hypothetical protein